MRLHIQTTPICSEEELRTLLIDAADELAGANSQVLEAKLPWDGYPILLVDAQNHPVLVSFDTDNSQTALFNGLRATEQLAVALPWVNQVYEDLRHQQKAPRLVVVGREPPPGTAAVLGGCPRLTLFTYKVLRINDDTGVWLECLGQKGKSAGFTDRRAEVPKAVNTDTQAATPAAESTPSLSEEECSYFRQL